MCSLKLWLVIYLSCVNFFSAPPWVTCSAPPLALWQAGTSILCGHFGNWIKELICEKCNHVTIKKHYIGKTGGILTLNEQEVLRELLNQQPCKRNISRKNRVLVNQKMLTKFLFPVTIYHILSCVDTGWYGLGFFVEPYFNPDSSN